ncbi:helix-turn-helix domain containing protein [Aliarcobacter butzleri]|uniref:helix-turn-helix domain containing protein n=1 Tax=Aliarcobacter butzleri TaxID=28197 RepID=UPI0021B2AC53|nr:helix-turn-helix domain containing protein [Aliarcobacter butzleri]MCT7562022.1 helix-turn-helix domain containing protein [Aliarcobacter butzleri]
MEINDIIDRLFDYFEVTSIQDLAEKMNVSQPTISKWKTRNAISAIKKRCRELGIYNEIFVINDFTSSPGYNYDYDLESPPSIYDEAQKELVKQITKRRTVDEILKMDETIVTSFMQVYKKLEKENNLIKLYEALGKLKYGS